MWFIHHRTYQQEGLLLNILVWIFPLVSVHCSFIFLVELNYTNICWKPIMQKEMECYMELEYKDEEQTCSAIIKVIL